MSKIGKTPVKLPEGVVATLEGKTLKVQGPKGSLERRIPKVIDCEIAGGEIVFKIGTAKAGAPALFGTTRAHVANMVKGVSAGWTKDLELVGTGYRAEVSGNSLILAIGYSHPVKITAPEGVSFKVEKSIITVSGIDKEIVGQITSDIRGVRPPEPYKGKGIKYVGETVRRKAGKAAKTEGAAA